MAKKKKKISSKRQLKQQGKRGSRNQRKPSAKAALPQPLKSMPLLIGLLVVVLLSAWAYWPSLDGELTNWDDEEYVLMNSSIQEFSSENLNIIFTDPVQGNYHPLTMLSLGLSYSKQFDEKGNVIRHERKGYIMPDPVPFHAGNLLLHILSTLLLGLLIFYLFGGKWLPAVLVAGIFALHPMHVESIAWVTARKDALYGLFFIAGLLTYLAFVRKRSWLFFGASLALFTASVLSKPAAVVFPVILFALDYWEDRKLNFRLILEKAPFLIISLIIGLLTVQYQSVEAIGDWERFSLWERLMYASHSFVGYIIKFFYPFPLKIFYPYPKFGDPPLLTQLAPLAAVLILAFGVYAFKRYKALCLGLMIYLFSIALVLQFVSVGGAIMAERYTYIPYIGLSIPIAWYIDKLFSSSKQQSLGKGLAIFCGLVLMLFAWQSRQRTEVWQNADTLYSSILKIHPNLHGMLLNRGNYFLDKGEYDKARKDYQRAIKVKPEDSDALFNVALIYNTQRQYQKAIDVLDSAIALNKTDFSLFSARADNYKSLSKFRKALTDYSKSIEIDNGQFLSYLNRGICYFSLNQPEKAKEDFIKVTQLQPNLPEGYNNVGYLLIQLEDFEGARKNLARALQLDPENVNALSNMAIYHGRLGEKKDARSYIAKLRALGKRVDQQYLENLVTELGLN